MQRLVLNYAISWASAQHKGYITLMCNDNQGNPTLRFPLSPNTSDEFLCLLTILENERPVFWDETAKCLVTNF